jgi:hypothetical protein
MTDRDISHLIGGSYDRDSTGGCISHRMMAAGGGWLSCGGLGLAIATAY